MKVRVGDKWYAPDAIEFVGGVLGTSDSDVDLAIDVAAAADVTALQSDVSTLESGGGTLFTRRISFTETAGAGTYTGTVDIPAGGVLHHVERETTAGWDADTTAIDLGVTGDLTRYESAVDVDGVGNAIPFGVGNTEPMDYFASGTTFTAAITTTGAGGTTGRTFVTVVYSVPPAATAATKA